MGGWGVRGKEVGWLLGREELGGRKKKGGGDRRRERDPCRQPLDSRACAGTAALAFAVYLHGRLWAWGRSRRRAGSERIKLCY
jgi:hypothetical protein